VCQRKSKGEVDISSIGSEKEEEEEAPVPTTPNGRPIRKRRKTSNFTPAAAAAAANDDDDSSAADSDEDDNFKPKEEEDDSAESDEEFDFDEDDTKSKKKKKGTTTAATKRKKRQSAPASLKSSSSNNNKNKANKKFGKLKPGTKFITNYGIVQVISDNRIPSNYNNKSTIDDVASRNFHKRKQRYNDRYQLMEENIAVGQRYRREELMKIYLTSKKHGGGTNNIQQQQQQVWELYCKSFTPTQILNEGLSARKLNVMGSNEIESVKESFDNVDPRYPKDRYPNRIVECKLVEDTREVVIGSVSSSESSGGGDAAVPEYHVKEEKVKSKRKVVVPMRLYIARKDLIKEFGSSDTNYVCNNCGKDYPFREGLKYHLTTRACGTVKKSAEKKERDDRIVSIETKALSSSGNDSSGAAAAARDTLLTSLHGALKLQERVSLQKRPAGFGNPHKIKEFKKHKMPPWLVFNDDRSSMYPEIYVTLGFKRGSQNRNWATKKRLEDGYVPRWEQKKDYKKRKRMSLDHHPAETKPAPVLSTQVTTAGSALASTTSKKSSTIPKSKSTQKKKPSTKQKKTKKQPAKEKTKKDHHPLELPSEPPALPPLPTIANPDDVVMDVDFDGSGNDDLIFETSDPMLLTEEVPAEEIPNKMAAVPQPMLKKAAAPPPLAQKPPATVAPPVKKTNAAPQDSVSMSPPASKKKDATKAPPAVTTKGGNNKRKATTAASASSSSTTTTSKKSRRKGITINKKKDCVVIDTQVLATECESGRYPTINRYYGLHEAQCTICKKDDDDGTPLIHCDFCKNSCHQLCIDKRMLLKDPQVIIRENEPDDTPMCNECISTCLFRRWRAESRRITKWQHELAKAGLGNVPEAAGLTEEVNLKGGKGMNDVQSEDDDSPTYKPCPDGGPGGLICCSYCTASYSRFLSNTAKEMEAQSVSRVGQEVSEILELLADAKQRLQRASDVSQSNDDRRGLLDTNQSAHGGLSIGS